MSRKLAYASRASDRHSLVARQRPVPRTNVPLSQSRSATRSSLILLLGLPLLSFLSFLVLAQAWMIWQVQQLYQQQAKLRDVFVCTERRFNNPGTYGGTRCLPPNEPALTPLEASSPSASQPAP